MAKKDIFFHQIKIKSIKPNLIKLTIQGIE